MRLHPVQVSRSYTTSVETLEDAWVFVMDRLDLVGPDPRIEISPQWTYSMVEIDREQSPPRHFSVRVSGDVEEDLDA